MMAAVETDPKRQQAASQEPAPQPPTYYMANGQGGVACSGMGSNPSNFHTGNYSSQVTFMPPNQATTVMVTQPVVVTANVNTNGPDTTCAFILSTLSAIFCGFWCGTAAILITWKAKLLVLDQKYEHARHTVRVVWLFLGLGAMFGLAIWICVGIYLSVLSSLWY